MKRGHKPAAIIAHEERPQTSSKNSTRREATNQQQEQHMKGGHKPAATMRRQSKFKRVRQSKHRGLDAKMRREQEENELEAFTWASGAIPPPTREKLKSSWLDFGASRLVHREVSTGQPAALPLEIPDNP